MKCSMLTIKLGNLRTLISLWGMVLYHSILRTTRLNKAQALAGLLAIFVSLPVAAGDLQTGLSFLSANQQADGSWGDTALTQARDTAVVIDTLSLLGKTGADFNDAITWSQNYTVRNNDELARKTKNQLAASADATSLLQALLDAQSLGAAGTGGWGIASGFDSDTLDTALALNALHAEGDLGGLTIVNETVQGSSTSVDYPFFVPAGSSANSLFVRSLSGNARFLLRLPSNQLIFIDLTPANTPVNVTLPSDAGDWAVIVENQTASAISFSAEVNYIDAQGVDVSRFNAARAYLGSSQNADGGWGLMAGGESHLMITAEIMRTLAVIDGFVGTSVLSDAANWLTSNHQNIDGGFSSAPDDSNVNETSLAVIALALSNTGVTLDSASIYLDTEQQANGSWDDDVYLTAIAMQASLSTQTRGPVQVTSNGGAGAGASFVTNLNTADIFGVLPLGVSDIRVNGQLVNAIIDGENGTFKISLTLNEGLNNFTLTSVDGFGFEGDSINFEISRDSLLQGQQLSLNPGLNMIGLRLMPANPMSAIDLLELLGADSQQISRLDKLTGLYDTVTRDGGGYVGADFTLNGLDSLLVTMSGDYVSTSVDNITGSSIPGPVQVDLLAGINAVTIPDPPDDLTASSLAALIGGETIVGSIQNLNTATGRFGTIVYDAGNLVGADFDIKVGESYIIGMLQDVLGFTLPVGFSADVSITDPADGETVTTSPLLVSGTAQGESPLTVTVNGVSATVIGSDYSALVPLSSGANTLIATVTDAGSRIATDSITVTLAPVDHVIPLTGTVTGIRLFSGEASVLDQAAFFTETQILIPAGIAYATTGVSRISATEMQISYQITATASASPGIQDLQVEYGLIDGASIPLGPLVDNVFDIRIEVTP